MISNKKLLANRDNAQKSTGPKDTSRTRLNALKHSILSSELVTLSGEGQESLEIFEALGNSLRDYFKPVGALEELLV